ncbi:50S ribosomal protein L1 [Candidatus Woesearchaeota archaeon]|nr:50S ribosomal protein L1 [Candidatus Woesearchaeota archaeon]
MEKQEVLKSIKELREKSPKKNFSQSVDLVINLQNLDLKKPEHKVDLYLQLPHPRGKKLKLCAFVDAQLAQKAKGVFDNVVTKDEFAKWINNKKEQKKLANSNDFFVAQVEIMAQVAVTFGKVLGARGKMPNPKAGCVVPGSISNLEPIANKLQNTVKLQTKNETSVKTSIGIESMKDEDLADNVLAVYNTLLSKLPQEKNNIKYTAIKFTMGPIIKIGEQVKQKK